MADFCPSNGAFQRPSNGVFQRSSNAFQPLFRRGANGWPHIPYTYGIWRASAVVRLRARLAAVTAGMPIFFNMPLNGATERVPLRGAAFGGTQSPEASVAEPIFDFGLQTRNSVPSTGDE